MKNLLQLILLIACTSLGFAADKDQDKQRARQVDDIREAVFRWQFDHNASGQQKKAKVYFLRLQGKEGDPTDEFMKRFAGHSPPVRKASACESDAKKGVRDKTTGEMGLVFWISNVRWKSDTEVELGGGYDESSRSASSNAYVVKKVDGKWKVTSDKMMTRS
jgi:hypothetical protein